VATVKSLYKRPAIDEMESIVVPGCGKVPGEAKPDLGRRSKPAPQYARPSHDGTREMPSANPMISLFERAALEAGKAIMEVRDAGAHVTMKSDASPVTEADERAERIILDHLHAAYPDIPVIAEESVAAGRVPETDGGSFFLVDPLDGTREFIAASDEFTVNIALIEAGVPTAGIVYAPAKATAYTGADGHAEKLHVGANFEVDRRETIFTKPAGGDTVALISRSHNSPETDAYLTEKRFPSKRAIGSSLKFCVLAEGEADVYPRFGCIMQWDTAAGDAVLRAAGGMTLGLDGKPLPYGDTGEDTGSGFGNQCFIAWGKAPG